MFRQLETDNRIVVPGTHLSPLIQVGPRVTKYWIEIVFEGAIIFYIEKSSENPARFDMS